MFIQPSTEIKILHDVPIEDTYEHTLWFNTLAAQTTYFSSKTKYSINDSVYQRVDNKNIKVAISAESLYDCNYIMFKNTGFGNKWFYAFLTNIQYVNNDTSIITYEIDVMQTWHFDYQMKQCYVLREHPVTDVIGEHTVPENVETGDYITLATDTYLDGTGGIHSPRTKHIAIYCTGIPPELDRRWDEIFANFLDRIHKHEPGKINGCFVSCWTITIETIPYYFATILETINIFFNADTEGNRIISVFTYLAELTNLSSSMKYDSISNAQPITTPNVYLSNRSDGRPIQNKKLYTYPYCSLVMHTQGQSCEFRYERFNNSNKTYKFTIFGSFCPNPKYIAVATSYCGMVYDFEHAVTLSNLQQLAWTNDGYQIWLAQNQAQHTTYISTQENLMMVDAISGALNAVSSGGVGIATGNPNAIPATTGSITSTMQKAASRGSNMAMAVAKKTDAKATPDSVNGELSCDSVLTYSGDNVFYAYHRSIRPEYVTIIDNYFSKFGYQTNLNKIPNRNSRPHWNYVKTSACVITGSVPNVYTQQICSIYNNGITFWKNPSEVGNYNLDNRA